MKFYEHNKYPKGHKKNAKLRVDRANRKRDRQHAKKTVDKACEQEVE